jgi:uncharacterized caspase-like protein
VIAETRDGQRPWEQGSLLERFEFVPDGTSVKPTEPAVSQTTTRGQTQVAALERSVGDAGAIEDFLRNQYLAPNAGAIGEMVEALYANPTTVYGTPFDMPALVKVKTDWFAQFASWTLALEPGSLKLTPRGEDRAEAVFAMQYDYVPKAAGAARLTGKARVTLGLVMTEGKWRIASETSEAIQ